MCIVIFDGKKVQYPVSRLERTGVFPDACFTVAVYMLRG